MALKAAGGGLARKLDGRSRAFPVQDDAALFPEPGREPRNKKDIYFTLVCRKCQGRAREFFKKIYSLMCLLVLTKVRRIGIIKRENTVTAVNMLLWFGNTL